MSKKYSSRLKNILIPCCFFSLLTGAITGAIIFLFRVCAEHVIHTSDGIYEYVREHPAFLPLLILGAAALGALSYLIIKRFPNSRGGDAQTAITSLRGFIPLKWVQNTVVLFFSSLVTYFSGVPLGEEGTSVQMGAAVGKGTVNTFAKNRHGRAWERYIMTGGACGGFAAATFAPLTAILFAFDEAHRKFSPIIFMSSATAVLSAWSTLVGLCSIFSVEPRLFVLETPASLPLYLLWAPVIVGALCGLLAILYAKAYQKTEHILNKALKRVPLSVKFIAVFVIIAIFGYATSELIGSGHHIIHDLFEGHTPVWYMLLLYLVLRSIMLLISAALEISGGLSVPAMAVGAMVGSLTAQALSAMGIFPAEHSPVLVIIGLASFMAATNRAPLNAITFACEALFGFSNLISISLGVAVAFIVIEPLGVTAFSDVIIEEKIHDYYHGKEFHTVDVHMTVRTNSFIMGKEIRDILWPANCAVVSVNKLNVEQLTVETGDILHIRYKTIDPEETYAILESIVGRQKGDVDMHDVHEGDENYIIPEQ